MYLSQGQLTDEHSGYEALGTKMREKIATPSYQQLSTGFVFPTSNNIPLSHTSFSWSRRPDDSQPSSKMQAKANGMENGWSRGSHSNRCMPRFLRKIEEFKAKRMVDSDASCRSFDARKRMIQVLAVVVGSSELGLPESGVLLNGDPGTRVPMVYLFYVVVVSYAEDAETATNSREILLVDTGFTSERLATCFKVTDFRPSDDGIVKLSSIEALEHTVGIKPGDVDKIILTHFHWDHAGGLHLFPNAKVYLRADEYEWVKQVFRLRPSPRPINNHTGKQKVAQRPWFKQAGIEDPAEDIFAFGLNGKDYETLVKLEQEGRLVAIPGSSLEEIIPAVYTVSGFNSISTLSGCV